MLPVGTADDSFSQPMAAEPTLSEVWDAGLELAQQETFIGTWARNTAVEEMNKGPARILSAKEANEAYPVEKAWDKPVNEQTALHLSEEHARKQELKRTIEAGPTGAWGTNFAASTIAHVLDPVETGAGLLLGMGLAGIGSALARSAAPAVARTGQLLAKGGFAKDVAENFVGNLAAEAYVVEGADTARTNYDYRDAVYNSVIGSIVGTGVSRGATYGVKKAFGKILGKNDNAVGAAVAGTRGALENGKLPDVDGPAKAYNEIAHGNPPPGAQMGQSRSEFKFTPFESDQAGDIKFFAPTKQAGTMDGGTRQVGDYFGEGLTITDNPHVANNIAGHHMEDLKTDVAEISLEDARLFDLDKPVELTPEEFATLPESIQGILQEAESYRDAVTQMRQLVDEDELTEQAFEEMNAFVRSQGYDGYKLAHDGENPFHQVHIFPESASKLKQGALYKADVASVPQPNQARMAKETQTMGSPESDLFFDAAAKKEWDDFTVPAEKEIADTAKVLDEHVATLDSMEKAGMLDPEMKKVVETIKEEKSLYEQVTKAAADFAFCLLG